MTNSVDSLDLYAKIEGMLDNELAVSSLYASYLKVLDDLEFASFLDVGCGSGGFLELIKNLFDPDILEGIDLSPVMVERTRNRGIDAQAVELCDLEGTYDVITAVFDMVNYLNPKELKKFLGCIYDKLNNGGYFICDINTEYGFEEIASGSFTAEDEEKYLIIDSYYEDGVYQSDFTLFEKEKLLYHRMDEQITQYLHTQSDMAQNAELKLISAESISLYAQKPDKRLLLFKKERK